MTKGDAVRFAVGAAVRLEYESGLGVAAQGRFACNYLGYEVRTLALPWVRPEEAHRLVDAFADLYEADKHERRDYDQVKLDRLTDPYDWWLAPATEETTQARVIALLLFAEAAKTGDVTSKGVPA